MISGGWKTKAIKGFLGRDTKAYSASGAISLNADMVTMDSSGGALAMTLADGAEGQRMTIAQAGSGTNNCVITPANFFNGSTMTSNGVGEMVDLIFVNGKWQILTNIGSVAVA